ncbi:MAG: transcription termination factor Rho [Clostridia bacterium]|nr:transcription termination factor Rho [Clostridia bacterium]
MKYTKEYLDRAYNIHDLRVLLSELGGTPGSMNKESIINAILQIQDGVVPTKKVQGRKSIREKYEESLKGGNEGEYELDSFDEVAVENNPLDGENSSLEKTVKVSGTFEKSENYDHGFLRGNNFKPSEISDVYVSGKAIKHFQLREGDYVEGVAVYGRDNGAPSLKSVEKLNCLDYSLEQRPKFNDFEPTYPTCQIKLEKAGENDLSLRAIDILSPIGRGQRALIVAPPKAGKTTLIKKIASSIDKNYKDIYLMVVLIGERPEEVTDFKRSVNCELIYSTFDDKAKNHVRISKLAIEKAKRQVESGKHVVLLLDSLTRLTRAYNETLPSSGKTLTGGIDPVALQEPKSLFGSARSFDGAGSLTVIATALVDTGSKMDEVIYEEFKGTGNSEIYLSRELSERRIFPSIELYRSGTRRDDLILDSDAMQLAYSLRRDLDNTKDAEVKVLNIISKTSTNEELIKNQGKLL